MSTFLRNAFRIRDAGREEDAALTICKKSHRRPCLRPAAEAHVHDELAYKLAGLSAQWAIRPDENTPTNFFECEDLYQDHNDWMSALTLARQAAHAMRTGEDDGCFDVEAYFDVEPEDISEVEHMRERALSSLRRFFNTSWGNAATQAVADALMESRELDYASVAETLDQVQGDRDEAWKALQLHPEPAQEKDAAPVGGPLKG